MQDQVVAKMREIFALTERKLRSDRIKRAKQYKRQHDR